MSPKATLPTAIQPPRVRYIKLGRAGKWGPECIKAGIVRFGFGTGTDQRLRLCKHGKWDELTASFLKEGKDQGTATRFTNETRLFFEDDGKTLWISFVGEQLWWGFLTAEPPQKHSDGDGVWRKVKSSWRSSDIKGEPLTKDRLSGALTKLASYRGTTCKVDVEKYLVRRINGLTIPEVEKAIAAQTEMCTAALDLMRLLGPRDFEVLVDLVFTSSGWRRLGVIGKTQKTLDLDLLLPSTGERAFVQVKSKTNSKELADYISKLDDLGPYDRMFYVFHSGKAQTNDERVNIVGPQKLAELVVEAGLVGWLIRKTS